jgi:nucleoside-diphosphate-sugar epimerase
MARVLIVGCGCRGQELARELTGAGHAVRGTTRDAANIGAIEAAGAEGAVADPDRLGTLLPLLAGVTVACWLMGTAEGDDVAALHGDRLDSLLGKLVDSGVRGLVYEAAGSVDAGLLDDGAARVQAAGSMNSMPVAVIATAPSAHADWLAAARAAVDEVLAG